MCMRDKWGVWRENGTKNSNYLGAVGSVCAVHFFFASACLYCYLYVNRLFNYSGWLFKDKRTFGSVFVVIANRDGAEAMFFCGHCLDYLISERAVGTQSNFVYGSGPNIRKGNKMTGYFASGRKCLLSKLHKERMTQISSDIV